MCAAPLTFTEDAEEAATDSANCRQFERVVGCSKSAGAARQPSVRPYTKFDEGDQNISVASVRLTPSSQALQHASLTNLRLTNWLIGLAHDILLYKTDCEYNNPLEYICQFIHANFLRRCFHCWLEINSENQATVSYLIITPVLVIEKWTESNLNSCEMCSFRLFYILS